ncbi:MAG TPA: ribbon-helix-helix domain-containing protein [Acidobacteriota bacterium]|nr:ribbon-helix-helix domain-containing protein [Acidobacteriota bacterium]
MDTERPEEESSTQAGAENKEGEGASEEQQQSGKASAEGEKDGGFRNFVDGTARIAVGVGSTLGEAFKGIAGCCSGRNHVVMVRVDDDSLKRIDQLVDAGIFRSRSESSAWLIGRGIGAEARVFSLLESKVEEINRLRDELRSMLGLEEQEPEPEQEQEQEA